MKHAFGLALLVALLGTTSGCSIVDRLFLANFDGPYVHKADHINGHVHGGETVYEDGYEEGVVSEGYSEGMYDQGACRDGNCRGGQCQDGNCGPAGNCRNGICHGAKCQEGVCPGGVCQRV